MITRRILPALNAVQILRAKINSVRRFNWIAQSGRLFEKFNFRFSEKRVLTPASRSLRRGASANRHERWGRDAMDAEAVRDERGRCGRRNRVVLISRRWDQVSWMLIREATVARTPGHRGERA